MEIQGSAMEPGIENQLNNWGLRGSYRPMLLSSPKLDDLSTSAWYLGNFKKQFKRKWKMRFDVMNLGADTQAMLTAMIAFQSRVCWDVEIGATDYVWVAQSLSGSTAPTAVTP